jgi:hypothetical protein
MEKKQREVAVRSLKIAAHKAAALAAERERQLLVAREKFLGGQRVTVDIKK